ncbi:MAG: HNH endonuclease [Paracoccaceae bacterium]
MQISRQQLIDALIYDPATGLFLHRKRKNPALFTVHRPHGYLTGNVLGKRLLAHRVAWAITHDEWPDQIDHINRIKTDNRLCNLRPVSPMVNSLNRPNLPGRLRGITKAHKRYVWVARLGCTYLGCFDQPELAALAYDRAAILQGLPRDLLNFPEQTADDVVNEPCKRLGDHEPPAPVIAMLPKG